MVQWIAILAVLVCLSGSSLSRSWVGFDDDDYFELSLAEADNDEQSRKARHQDDWESDEDYEDSGYVHGYGKDKPNTGIYDHDSQALSYHDDHDLDYHGYDHHGFHSGFDHQHENHGYNHHGHHDNKDVHGHHHKFGSSNLGSSQNGPGQVPYNQGLGNHRFPGHRGQHSGAQGRPSPVESSKLNRPGQNSGAPSEGGPRNNQNQQTSRNDADRVVFPDVNNQIPTTRGPSSPTPTVTTVPTPTTTNRTLLNRVLCVRACPATSEYNPVCGSNNVTYNNPGALQCAANCGVNVALARRAPCPRFVSQSTTNASATSTTPRAAQTTARPSTTTPVPTRFTNINLIVSNKPNSTSIPLDLLLSIFGQPSTNSKTEEPDFNINKWRIP